MRRILALDQATTTGVAWTHDLCVASRWSTIYRLPDTDRGARFADYRHWLLRTIRRVEPDLIAYERGHHRGFNTTMLLLGLAAVIEQCAAETGISYLQVRDGAVKTHASGKGRIDKAGMVALAQARGWHIRNDDEADALWLLDYVCARISAGELRVG